ncbi:hypothetical protein [Wukongibacter sp. M2B1]|uniref:hypothetical protein n=1 Tax=Wukongibacter sp. M2B1 TaxID=3088895 RepID=UPI003D7BB686
MKKLILIIILIVCVAFVYNMYKIHTIGNILNLSENKIVRIDYYNRKTKESLVYKDQDKISKIWGNIKGIRVQRWSFLNNSNRDNTYEPIGEFTFYTSYSKDNISERTIDIYQGFVLILPKYSGSSTNYKVIDSIDKLKP